MIIKDIFIPARTVKIESLVLVASLVSAFLLNVYSIIKYKTSWMELFSQVHVVLILGVLIYLLILLFRLIFYFIFRLFSKK
jgi:hypothetical protein